jgi:AraC-like DNA-binding protein
MKRTAASPPRQSPASPLRDEQRTVLEGREAVRIYELFFDAPHRPGPGCLLRASRITDSWGMRPRLERDPAWRRTLQWQSLVYVMHGSGTFIDDHGSHDVEAGDVLCLFAGVPHAYAPRPGSRWDEINVDFVGRAFDAWQGPGLLDPAEPVRRLRPPGYWTRRFEAVVTAVRGDAPTLRDTGHLLDLIAEMAADWRQTADADGAAWVERVREKLDATPAEADLDMHALAASFGIGEQALRKRFRQVTGQTPAQYRIRRRLARACLLLEQTGETCREIAHRLGFESEHYFSRRFRQLVGEAPGEYRQRHASARPARRPRQPEGPR